MARGFFMVLNLAFTTLAAVSTRQETLVLGTIAADDPHSLVQAGKATPWKGGATQVGLSPEGTSQTVTADK
eukprot:CAMPEP_0197938684 /NCGR_PEP_ID=MMETSP1439-20131203/118537_1 /TAXON_ID=66791 /ORGANISM="Gonyaulax spinifera, Strain CCMP409" /LENGTH=70 /DNA_ID=CAMNT_0043561763 /DNA_START=99 /DNA_END=308 /DNA_ORIENTATION=+